MKAKPKSDSVYDPGDNKTHLVIVNAVIIKDDTVLISQRSLKEPHMPGKWTVPGGKVEKTEGDFWNIIEKTLFDEIMEETGVKIKDKIRFLTNNTFIRSTGHHSIALIFLCEWDSGEPQALEDTLDVKWIKKEEIENFDFAPNVDKYIKMGFEAYEI